MDDNNSHHSSHSKKGKSFSQDGNRHGDEDDNSRSSGVSGSGGSAFGMLQANLTQTGGQVNLRKCILLDNESTIHAFCNNDFIKNKYPAPNN